MKTFSMIMSILSISSMLLSPYTFDRLDVISQKQEIKEEVQEEIIVEEDPIVYDGLTLDELASKLDKNLNSTLSGYGYVFASKSIELGLDPYLAVAIVLHETGCKWNCSSLLKKCNNVGGIKGKPSCGNGSYRKFNSLDEGINFYLENLYNKYYSKGLTTPELIGPRYAESKTWSSKINAYIKEIKNS